MACMQYTRNVHKRLVRRSLREDTPGRAPRLRRENIEILVYILQKRLIEIALEEDIKWVYLKAIVNFLGP